METAGAREPKQRGRPRCPPRLLIPGRNSFSRAPNHPCVAERAIAFPFTIKPFASDALLLPVPGLRHQLGHPLRCLSEGFWFLKTF